MKSTSLKLGLFLLFTFLVYCQVSVAVTSNGCDGAGNCYVRAGASGSNNGVDWNNAYHALPSSLTRGVTYFVAGGSYAAHTFSDADSGTTLITIQAPTVANHGTDTGWSSSFASQAIFAAPIYFTTDYYTFNGVYRANTGQPWVDWRNQGGYGFAVNNNNGSNCPISKVNSAAAVAVGTLNGGVAANNVTIEYVNIIGAGNLAQASCTNGFDWGVSVNGYTATTQNFYLGYSYIHDTAADNVLFDGINGATAEYDYIDRSSEGSGTNHMEEVAIRNNTDNLIFRYNFIGACGDTACFATPEASGDRSNWFIYGNVFLINASEDPVAYSSGDGSLSVFSLSSITTLYYVNNTISSLSSEGPCGVFPWSPVTTVGVVVENNLYFNCPQNNGPATQGGVTWDYQAYYNSAKMCTNDTAPHTACSSTNPFVNVAQTAGANNFNLTAHTTAGIALPTSLPPGCTSGVNCFDTDMNGNSRSVGSNWDRGALEFSNGDPPPTPPTGLTAAVN
jgi:hypothetical protein